MEWKLSNARSIPHPEIRRMMHCGLAFQQTNRHSAESSNQTFRWKAHFIAILLSPLLLLEPFPFAKRLHVCASLVQKLRNLSPSLSPVHLP